MQSPAYNMHRSWTPAETHETPSSLGIKRQHVFAQIKTGGFNQRFFSAADEPRAC